MANSANSSSGILVDALASVGLGGGSNVSEQFSGLVQQLQQLQTVNQAVAETVRDNTRAVDTNTTTRSTGGESTGNSMAKTILGSIGTGLGLSPLITGIARLFGGGGSTSALPPLVKFALPPELNVTGGIGDNASQQAFVLDYAQGERPRPVVNPAAAQITVQIQAMDSQSFLDRSADIAMAVRQAMLESSVLNDVIREV